MSKDPIIKKVSIQLLVTDLDRSLGFYTEVLGFGIDFRYDDFYVGLSSYGFSIHLKHGKPSSKERQLKQKNQDLDIIFSVGNIEELYQGLSARQVTVIQPLREMPYGKEFYLADPDGYVIAFMEEV